LKWKSDSFNMNDRWNNVMWWWFRCVWWWFRCVWWWFRCICNP
jgi:hypothetical protein